MKIFEIIPQLSSGGAERFVVDLCNELSKGHEVTLLVLFPLNKTSFYLSQVSDKVRIETMNKKAGFDLPLRIATVIFAPWTPRARWLTL